MANDGKITLQDIIEDEALRFGEKYAEQAKIAINSNETLIKSAGVLKEVLGQYKGATNNLQLFDLKGKEKNAIDQIILSLKDEQLALKELNEERNRQTSLQKIQDTINKARQKGSTDNKKALDDERLAHVKLTNELKQEEQLERSVQRTKQESIKTDKEASELARKLTQEIEAEIKLLGEQQNLERKVLANEREESVLLKELERLEQQRLNTDKASVQLLNEEEKLKRSRLATLREEKVAIEQEQRIAKNTLDIKSKELTVAAKEEAAAKRNTVLTIEERVQNEALNKIKKQQAREDLGLVGAYEKLNRARRDAQMRLADLLAAEVKDRASIKATEREYEILNKKVREVDNAVDIFQKNIGNYPTGGFKNLQQGLLSLVSAFGVVGGIQAFADALKKSFDIVKNYEAEVVNLAAVAGKTRDQIQPLESTIQAVAAASINSATDVAKLATELIKLGSTPEEAEKLLKPVNDLSIALRATAEDAAGLVKGLLNAYGEGADQAARYTDVLAEAANRSALDFQGLRDAFSYIAPVARSLNFSLEQTAAMIGILADNGIKAESAGRLLGTGLGKIAQQGLTLEQALDKINQKQKEGASDLDVLTTANNLFGVEAGKLALILSNNREKIDEMTFAYENSRGSLEELTNKQLKSLDAQLEILDSSFEDYILKTNESTGASKTLTSTVSFLAENLGLIINTVGQAIGLWLLYRASIIAATLYTKIQTAATYAQIIAQGIMSNGLVGLRGNLAALNATAALNPFALLAVAVVGAVIALRSMQKTTKELTEETNKSTDEFLRSRDIQEKNIASTDKMIGRYEELKGKVNLSAKEQKEFNELTKALGEIAPDATTKVNKYGEAIQLSGDKLREYNKLQRENIAAQKAVEIEKQTELLKQQRIELERLRATDKEGGAVGLRVDDQFTVITKVNGVLQTRNNIFQDFRNLNNLERAAYLSDRVAAEKSVADTEAKIKALKGLTAAQKEASAAGGTGKKAEENVARTIEVIDAEIKAEQDKIDGLTKATKSEGVLIDKRIAILKKEREAIYSTTKAQKDAKKEREDYLARMKKIDDDAYNLAVFRLNRLKAQNEETIDDVNNSYQDQADAVIKNENVLLALNEESAEKKLKDISRYNDKVRDLTDGEINILLNGGKIKKKLNNEEILVLEEYQAKKDEVYKAAEKKLDDLQVRDFEKRLNNRNQDLNNALNQDIIRENNRFANERVAEGKREAAVEAHEKKIADLKREYAIKALQDQIAATEALLSTENLTAEKRKEIEATLSNTKRELSELVTQGYIQGNKKQELSDEEKNEKLKDLALNLKDSLVDLTNSIFDNRIQKIDDELNRLSDYYDEQLELAGDDERKKELIQKEADKKKAALEKKKRDEQRKQAIFNKAVKASEIIFETTLAVISALAQVPKFDFGISAAAIAAAYASIGAVQLATLLAQPIPKYKGGRKGGPKEVAWLGDGFVNEIIEDKKGNIRVTPAVPTLMQLEEGDTVHSSPDAYIKQVKNTVYMNIARENDKVKAFQKILEVDKVNHNLEKSIKDGIKKGFKDIKININNEAPKVDIPHALWALKNTKWN